MNKIDEFKIELAALLKKYNATITCGIDGDTHGLTCEMGVDFGREDFWKTYKLNDSNGIDYNDIIK